MSYAIRADGLSKRYRIAGANRSSGNLREDLTRAITSPWNRMRGGSANRHDFWALRDVSFEIPPGEVVGVIGRNGAGKSTLLKLLSRVTQPTSGYAEIRGRLGSLLEVGTGFHPELTGRENIYLSGAILGMRRSEIRRRFDEIIDFAGVEEFLETPVKRYSSGMQVRLGFAVAAHLEPEVLIVDEVLAVGDAEFQRKCLGKMEHVAQGGRTVLLVSHNMGAVRSLCPKSLVVTDGRITGPEPTERCIRDLFQDPNVGESGEAVDLATAKRSRADLPRKASFQHARFQASDRAAAALRPGCPATLEVTHQWESATNRVEVVCGIDDRQGTRLASCVHRFDAPEGVHTSRFRFDELPLAPGGYAITLGLRVGGTLPLDHIERAIVFEVETDPGSPHTGTPGPVILSGKCELHG